MLDRKPLASGRTNTRRGKMVIRHVFGYDVEESKKTYIVSYMITRHIFGYNVEERKSTYIHIVKYIYIYSFIIIPF